MTCELDTQLIQKTIDFHGHTCPGLAIGIRAAELARQTLALHDTTEGLCVTETDMCGVDAIQVLTNCTFGKGNLVHRDLGKTAFTFFRRDRSQGIRAVFRRDHAMAEEDRDALKERIMASPLEALFTVTPVEAPPVRPARILKSICCDECGEWVMESRIRLFDDRHLCMPCFSGVEQKV